MSDITNAEIAETIVRTAYSRVHDCLRTLNAQSKGLNEVHLINETQELMINMIAQDFSCAHAPSNGSAPLRHAKPNDKERDLEIASHFNTLGLETKNALAKSALTQLVGNFNKSPIAQDIQFKL